MPRAANDRPTRLTKQAIAKSARVLARRDPVLATVLKQFGPPPLLRRPATFATLVHIILEQQVSVESAKATFNRTKAACHGRITATALIGLNETGLKSLGFSRQKTRYALELANDITARRFSVTSLSRHQDDAVRDQIVARLGLGNWSADVFLMMALLRPDILPVGDLALVKGIKELDKTDYGSSDQILERAELWRPFRSVATRMVWQWYVYTRGRDIF